jgi:hypothetical protein
VTGVERVRATVALTHEAGGWRIALPEHLSPRYAIRHASELTPGQVRRRLDTIRRLADRVRGRALHRLAVTSPLVTGPTACPRPVRGAADAARDVTLANGGDLTRRQDDAGVDLIGASQSLSGNRVCFELRFRTPLPAETSIDLWLSQRFPIRGHPLWADAVRVEVEGNGAVALRDVVTSGLGPPYFAPIVRLSPARDALSVDIRASRGWPAIDPARPYGWSVQAWRVLPTGDNAYLDELEP